MCGEYKSAYQYLFLLLSSGHQQLKLAWDAETLVSLVAQWAKGGVCEE